MAKIIRKIVNFIKSLFKGLWGFFEFRDIIVYGGLYLFGYGLWLLRPWLGFAVPGLLLFLLGLLWPVFLNFTARGRK